MTFSQRVFQKRGMRAFTTGATVPLPGPNVFRPACHSCPTGLRAFYARVAPPVFPGPNIFRGLGRLRRGMGQDEGLDYTNPVVDWSSALTSGLSTPAPTFSVASDIPSEVSISPSPTLSLPGNVWQPGGSTLLPSSNPALDAFNQALTNAQASNQSLLNPATLAHISNAVAAATPAQLASATSSLTGTGASGALNSLGTWASQNMGILLLGGGGILALTLIAGGKRR